LYLSTSQNFRSKASQQNHCLGLGGEIFVTVCHQVLTTITENIPQAWSLPKNGKGKNSLITEFYDFESMRIRRFFCGEGHNPINRISGGSGFIC